VCTMPAIDKAGNLWTLDPSTIRTVSILPGWRAHFSWCNHRSWRLALISRM
jgi:hypothetical protein